MKKTVINFNQDQNGSTPVAETNTAENTSNESNGSEKETGNDEAVAEEKSDAKAEAEVTIFTKTKKTEGFNKKFAYLEDDLLALAEEKQASFDKCSPATQNGPSGAKQLAEIQHLKDIAELVGEAGHSFVEAYDLPYYDVLAEVTPEAEAAK